MVAVKGWNEHGNELIMIQRVILPREQCTVVQLGCSFVHIDKEERLLAPYQVCSAILIVSRLITLSTPQSAHSSNSPLLQAAMWMFMLQQSLFTSLLLITQPVRNAQSNSVNSHKLHPYLPNKHRLLTNSIFYFLLLYQVREVSRSCVSVSVWGLSITQSSNLILRFHFGRQFCIKTANRLTSSHKNVMQLVKYLTQFFLVVTKR